MTVGAASGGGGVGTLTYDTNNAEEMSVLVSGGLGESETGGPVMNLVPRSGGNRFSGPGVLQHGRQVVERRQPRRLPARHRHPRGGRRDQRLRHQRRRSAARSGATVSGSSAASGKLTTAQGVEGHLRQRLRVRPVALGLPAGRQPLGARLCRAARCIRRGSPARSRRRTASCSRSRTSIAARARRDVGRRRVPLAAAATGWRWDRPRCRPRRATATSTSPTG